MFEYIGKALGGILILFLLGTILFDDPSSWFNWIIVAVIAYASRNYILPAIFVFILFDIFGS